MTDAAAPATPLQPPASRPSRPRGLSGRRRQPATSRATVAGQRRRPAGTGANLVLRPVLTDLDTVSITAEQHEQAGSALSAMIVAWLRAQAHRSRSEPADQTRAGLARFPATRPRPLPHPEITMSSTTTQHAVRTQLGDSVGCQFGQLGNAAEPPAVRDRPVGPWVGMTHQATFAAHHRPELFPENPPRRHGTPATGSLRLGRHRRSPMPPDSRSPVQRGYWPHNGESRYGPAPLRQQRSPLPNASQRTTKASDHDDQHRDRRAVRPHVLVGRLR
jgi:hypothetical protein